MNSLLPLLLSCCSVVVSSFHLRQQQPSHSEVCKELNINTKKYTVCPNLAAGGKDVGAWHESIAGDFDEGCVIKAATRGKTCKQWCGDMFDLSCLRSQDDVTGCRLDTRHTRQTTSENGCNQRYGVQMCVCGPSNEQMMINALQIQFDHLEADVEKLKKLIENGGTDCSECDHPNEPPATCAVIFPKSPENPNGVDCETVVPGCRHFTSVEACYEASVGFFSENARPGGAMDRQDRPPGCSVWQQQHSTYNSIEFNQDLTAKPSIRQICQCDVGSFSECTDGSRLQWYSSIKGYEAIHREP